jgi:hypothetical protein
MTVLSPFGVTAKNPVYRQLAFSGVSPSSSPSSSVYHTEPLQGDVYHKSTPAIRFGDIKLINYPLLETFFETQIPDPKNPGETVPRISVIKISRVAIKDEQGKQVISKVTDLWSEWQCHRPENDPHYDLPASSLEKLARQHPFYAQKRKQKAQENMNPRLRQGIDRLVIEG